ncbi:M15 family metallopeptidase [Paenibacillus daejeonensis]|uniref:M15 family metallopeptidase n=1 Tax=Paenibacillus daejeonensis TaxID=135193 RepID=UPI0003744E31|nr:M15 family metallopeptidase [Paenibacillus daejeonensis]
MVTLEQVRNRSAKAIAGLLPVVQEAAKRLVDRSYGRGVPIVITQGLRTIAEQDALYAQGRTAPGPIVTNARGGYSNHNYGVALDFALLLPDGRNVSWDMKRDGDGDGQADWMEVVEEAKRLGFSWGGDWVSFKDYPHLEMTFGLTTAQYRAGRRPTQAQLDAAMEIITRGEDAPMTEAEKQAFEALQQQVQQQAQLIQSLLVQKEAPAWAKPTIDKLVRLGYLSDPIGNHSFMRMAVVLDRAGIFDKS